MTAPYRGCDADLNPTDAQAAAMAAAGFSFFCGYLKLLTKESVASLARHGLKTVTIWETTAKRSELGYDAGRQDGIAAWSKMYALGAPAGAMVHFTTDDGVEDPAVHPYYQAIRDVLVSGQGPTLGIYADGAIQEVENAKGRWLAGAMGWPGSKTYQNATMVQGYPLRHGGMWYGINWPDLGFEYDPDLALVEEYGGWTPR